MISGELLTLIKALLIKKTDNSVLHKHSAVLTSCPNSGRASSAFLALLSSFTGSRDLRNLAGWGDRTLKGLELKNAAPSASKPAEILFVMCCIVSFQ